MLFCCLNYNAGRLQRLESLGQLLDRHHFHPFDGVLGGIGVRHDGATEAVLGRLLQPLLTSGDRTDLA